MHCAQGFPQSHLGMQGSDHAPPAVIARGRAPAIMIGGRRGSWDADPSMLASIIGRHLSSPSALVYGDNNSTAKVEPERTIPRFTPMWEELQRVSPNLSFKKKDWLLVLLCHWWKYVVFMTSCP